MHVFLSITYKACMLDSFVCVTYLHKCVCVTFDKVINIAPKSVKTKRGSCILTVLDEESMRRVWELEDLDSGVILKGKTR